MKNASIGLAIIGITLAACSSSKTAATPTSSLEGSVVSSSFKAAPSGLVAVDETGARTVIRIGTDGSFSQPLAKAHTYKLVVATGAGEEPVVFPRAAGGKLDLTFKISAGGAKLALGALRHFDAAPAGGFPALQAKVECENGGGDGDGECENGKDAKTGAPCTDDDDANETGHDGTKPMAVPEKSPPNDVSGCGEDGENGEEADDD